MAKQQNLTQSIKRIGVDKTNARIITITSAAAFLVVFFLVGAFSLFGQLTYQNRVIGVKKNAVEQLKENLTARDSLVESYNKFAKAEQNIIGGAASGGAAQDGSNPKLVLDALPGKYDFPALTTSLEKIARDQKVEIDSVDGVDDEIAQGESKVEEPQPVEMPFDFKVSGDYLSVQRTVDSFDKSIRPIQLQKLQITGESAKVTLGVTGVSFYQPAKGVSIKMEQVK